MKNTYILFLVLVITSGSVFAQNPLEKFERLIGHWEGKGSGFSSSKSIIESSFLWAMNKNYIEVKNRSEFAPTTQKPEGEIHEDWGMISFDKARKVFVFRQFHVEGFVNQYVLNDSISNTKSFIFKSEEIENFVPGGKARFTINIKNNTEIETLFDVGFPGKEMSCFGQNILNRK